MIFGPPKKSSRNASREQAPRRTANGPALIIDSFNCAAIVDSLHQRTDARLVRSISSSYQDCSDILYFRRPIVPRYIVLYGIDTYHDKIS